MCVGDTPNTIFAEPTTATGSIGVLIPLYSFAELAERWGIKDNTVATNPMKVAGSPLRKMTPEAQKLFQGYVNDAFVRFKEVIRQGRPKFRKDPAALDKLATGQIFLADQALENGLIDKIGFIEDAIDRAIALAKLDKRDVVVVKYKAPHAAVGACSWVNQTPARDSIWPLCWKPRRRPTTFAPGPPRRSTPRNRGEGERREGERAKPQAMVRELRHSERSEESGLGRNSGKILRCAQNDGFSAASDG